jgi:hypothetical protein
MDFNIYPAVDENNNFPQPVRQALVNSQEMTTATSDRIGDEANPVRQLLDGLYLSTSAIIDGGLP